MIKLTQESVNKTFKDNQGTIMKIVANYDVWFIGESVNGNIHKYDSDGRRYIKSIEADKYSLVSEYTPHRTRKEIVDDLVECLGDAIYKSKKEHCKFNANTEERASKFIQEAKEKDWGDEA